MPTSTATVRSAMTVRANVIIHTDLSAQSNRQMRQSRATHPCSRPRRRARPPASPAAQTRRAAPGQHDDQKRQRMNETGDRRAGAGPEVRRRPRNGARDRNPPTIGATRLATPCAISSALELWRSPVMESATTAESRLSTAAKSATVNAAGSSGRIKSARNGGMANAGKPLGMPPNLDPIVSTGN